MTMRTIVNCIVLAVLATIASLRAGETVIELPAETATYKPGKGVELAQAFCMTCHSVEYTAIQPPMPMKFWDAEIKKMREKYAAPIPPELDAKLVEYLVKAYGVPDATK